MHKSTMIDKKRFLSIDDVISTQFYEEFVISVDTNKRVFARVLKELEKH